MGHKHSKAKSTKPSPPVKHHSSPPATGNPTAAPLVFLMLGVCATVGLMVWVFIQHISSDLGFRTGEDINLKGLKMKAVNDLEVTGTTDLAIAEWGEVKEWTCGGSLILDRLSTDALCSFSLLSEWESCDLSLFLRKNSDLLSLTFSDDRASATLALTSTPTFEEITATTWKIADYELSESQISNMVYLDQVIDESMTFQSVTVTNTLTTEALKFLGGTSGYPLLMTVGSSEVSTGMLPIRNSSTITVTDNGDGTLTLDTIQDITTSSSPTFSSVKISSITSQLLATNASSQITGVSDFSSFISSSQVTVTGTTLSLPQALHTGATPTFASITVSGGDPTTDNELARKAYVDATKYLRFYPPVISKLSEPPGGESVGDRYLVDLGDGEWLLHNRTIAEYNGSGWDYTDILEEPWKLFLVTDENSLYCGSGLVSFVGDLSSHDTMYRQGGGGAAGGGTIRSSYHLTAAQYQSLLYVNHPGSGNVFWGEGAGDKITTGTHNFLFGRQAGALLAGITSGNYHVGLGDQCSGATGDQVMTGDDTVALGSQALSSATNDMGGSVALGYLALGNAENEAGIWGQHQVAVGYGAGSAVTTGYEHTLFGYQAGNTITTGSLDVMIGYDADAAATTVDQAVVVGSSAQGASRNVVVGYQSGAATTVSAVDNVLVGCQAGARLSSGARNVLIGSQVGYDSTSGGLTTGSNCTAIGYFALGANSTTALTGGDHVMVGAYAGQNLQGTAARNVGVGFTAAGTTTGTDQVAVGSYAGAKLTTGVGNVLVGTSVGYNTTLGLTTGGYRVGVGFEAMKGTNSDTTGSYNIGIGREALYYGPYGSNSGIVAVGYQAGRTCLGANNTFVGYQAGSGGNFGSSTMVGYTLNTVNGASATLLGYTGSSVDSSGTVAMGHDYLARANGVYINSKAPATGGLDINIGYEIYAHLTSPSGKCVFIGHHLGYSGGTYGGDFGAFSVAIGASAWGTSATANFAGYVYVVIGYQALVAYSNAISSTEYMVALGANVGAAYDGSPHNIFIGDSAAPTLTTGNQCLVIGATADVSGATTTNEIVIGYGATGNGSNTFTYGNGSITAHHYPAGVARMAGLVVGAPTDDYKGAGTINAVAVYDDSNGLSDYVFEKYYDDVVVDEAFAEYTFPSLSETEQFVKTQKHLPSMPSRAEFEASRPSVGRLINGLWCSAEERLLYIIELQKENQALQTWLTALESQIQTLIH